MFTSVETLYYEYHWIEKHFQYFVYLETIQPSRSILTRFIKILKSAQSVDGNFEETPISTVHGFLQLPLKVCYGDIYFLLYSSFNFFELENIFDCVRLVILKHLLSK